MDPFTIAFRKFRMVTGLTAHEIAERSAVELTTIFDIELGRLKSVPADVVERIKQTFAGDDYTADFDQLAASVTCETCRVFVPFDETKGECRFSPATPLVTGVSQTMALQGPKQQPVLSCIFPMMGRASWCGCYRQL